MTNLFVSFLGISVSTGFMVIVLMLLTPFINKRYAAKWKYLIWIFLALRLLVPFGGADGQSVMNTSPQVKTPAVSGQEEKDCVLPADAAIASRRIIVEIPAQMTAPITKHSERRDNRNSGWQSEKEDTGITMLDIAACVWLAGGLIFIFIHFMSYFHYKRQIMRKGRIIRDAGILRQMFALKHELHIGRTILAVEYAEAGSPMIIGFVKPVLVLPQEQYSPEELFFVLKHELVHLKRGDVWFKLLFAAANAVHWFNPLIWIMQKEAAVDMELSCDERVTRGAGYDVRKAYTETLLSMLHKRYAGRTFLSTQFYGGKRIMKKRFKNILLKGTGKNGIAIVFCAAILTIASGALVGCSVAKEDAGTKSMENESRETGSTGTGSTGTGSTRTGSAGTGSTGTEDEGNKSGPSEKEEKQTESEPAGNPSADNNTLAETTVLTSLREGEEVQTQATLVVGDGYSLFLPDDEEWRLSGPDLWITSVNERVTLWVTHFEGKSGETAESDLADEGYVKEEDNIRRKRAENVIYNVILKEYENDVWGIFYSYPNEPEYEEGWGRELPVIADTFAISVADGEGANSSTGNMSDYPEIKPAGGEGVNNGTNDINGYGIQEIILGAEDSEEMEKLAREFAEAFLGGRADAVREFLAAGYEEEIETYKGTGTISDLTVKGLSDADGKKLENTILWRGGIDAPGCKTAEHRLDRLVK